MNAISAFFRREAALESAATAENTQSERENQFGRLQAQAELFGLYKKHLLRYLSRVDLNRGLRVGVIVKQIDINEWWAECYPPQGSGDTKVYIELRVPRQPTIQFKKLRFSEQFIIGELIEKQYLLFRLGDSTFTPIAVDGETRFKGIKRLSGGLFAITKDNDTVRLIGNNLHTVPIEDIETFSLFTSPSAGTGVCFLGVPEKEMELTRIIRRRDHSTKQHTYAMNTRTRTFVRLPAGPAKLYTDFVSPINRYRCNGLTIIKVAAAFNEHGFINDWECDRLVYNPVTDNFVLFDGVHRITEAVEANCLEEDDDFLVVTPKDEKRKLLFRMISFREYTRVTEVIRCHESYWSHSTSTVWWVRRQEGWFMEPTISKALAATKEQRKVISINDQTYELDGGIGSMPKASGGDSTQLFAVQSGKHWLIITNELEVFVSPKGSYLFENFGSHGHNSFTCRDKEGNITVAQWYYGFDVLESK